MEHKLELNEIIGVAEEAALAAGAIIKQHFRGSRDGHRGKIDKSAIVTIADIEAERTMRDIIGNRFPHHSIRGEELPDTAGPSPYTWILDPIDGTGNFAMGKPIFGCLIAVLKDEQPVVGLIYQPILNELFLGMAGCKTLMNNMQLQAAHTSSLSGSLMATNPPYMFESSVQKQVLAGLSGAVRCCEFGGDCYNYAMLASGHIDVALSSGEDFRDFAAVIPIILGASGCITDWSGNALGPHSDGNIIATANPALHEAALANIKVASEEA